MATTLTDDMKMLSKIPLFSGIEPAKLKLLAFASSHKFFDTGEDLFKQGDYGDTAYLIIDGVADIIIENNGKAEVIAQAKEHEFIGEIAILCDVPRTATVRSNKKLETLEIQKKHFLNLITQVPDLGIEVMRELASRLNKTTSELSALKYQQKS